MQAELLLKICMFIINFSDEVVFMMLCSCTIVTINKYKSCKILCSYLQTGCISSKCKQYLLETSNQEGEI